MTRILLLRAFGHHLPAMHRPTPAQLDAGNYPKQKLRFQGLEISIENPRGSIRRGVDRGGKEWATAMQHHYGYIRGTLGVDGADFDVLVGPSATAPTVYVVTTMAPPDFSATDEQKALLGFSSEEEARAAFLGMYDDPRFLGSVTAMPVEEFKRQVLTTRENPRLLKARILFFKNSVHAELPVLFIKANPHHDALGRFARSPESGRGSGDDSDMADFLSGKVTGVRVVAKLPEDIGKYLGAKTTRVFLSSDTRDTHGKHKWTAEDLSHLQAVLDCGEIRSDKDNHIIAAHHDGAWWYAVVKVTENRKEVYLQSFRRTNDDQIKSFRKRGTLVRQGLE